MLPHDTKPGRDLRVLMVSTERGWRGGERMLASLVSELPGGVDAVTTCPPGSPLAQRLEAAGKAVEPLDARGPLDLAALRRLRRLAVSGGFDLVHAHTSHAHALALPALVRTGIPLAVTRHVAFPVKRLSRWKYRAVRRFAAVSAFVRDTLVRGGVRPARVDVIPNGIKLFPLPEDRDTHRSSLGIAPAELAVVSAGHFSAEKNHRLLLEAWAAVAPRHPSARLRLAGEGPLEGSLRALVRDRDLPRVVFEGYREDLPALLRAADLYVSSSDSEGQGLSVMEAMAAGLPVAATRAGGVLDLVADGETGILVPVGDARALASALDALLEDAERRAALGRAGRARAERDFGLHRMASAYRDFYLRALERN
ncbi:MAG: glycosyltransferase family 4 protein [Acidobacteria bacterium]|nr:glycosyltransferase family 4 protein [Acidobacteriota bacterium]